MKKYDKYKDSGIDWLGEIPECWEVKKSRHYFNFSKGLSITKENLQEVGVPCVSYGEIHSQYGFEVDPKKDSLSCVSSDYIDANKKSLLSRGDFVFADTSEDLKGSGNFTHLHSDCQTFAGYHTIVARLKTNDNYRFVSYVLDSLNFRHQIRSQVKGVKVFSITNKILKDTFLWTPQLPEQTTIAAFLNYKTEQIDSIIQKKEQLIEKLIEQRQAIINVAVSCGLDENGNIRQKPESLPANGWKDSGIEWLGAIPEHWEVKKLKYLAVIKNGKDQKEVLIENGKYPILGTGGKFGRSNSYLHNKPSVLLGRKGTIDDPIFIEEPFWTVDTLFYTDIYKNVNPKFFFYLCKTIHFDYYQESSAVPSMTQDNLNNIQLCFTSYSEQNVIVEYLDKKLDELDRMSNKLELSIEKLKQYRQSLISETVTGKIDVRDWKPKTKIN